MYPQRKLGFRAEYRETQRQRIIASPTLADKYRKLKSLKVNASHFAPDGKTQQKQLTYDINLSHAKSVFRFDCSNDECVQGDHELTKELEKAVAKGAKTLEGELCCA